MKKLFTVLAVLLVASVVFAATFAGEVAAKYTFDFDAKTVSYGKPGLGSVDVKFQWDTGDVVVGGEGDVHIDFKAVAAFEGYYNLSDDHAEGYDPFLKFDDNGFAKPSANGIAFGIPFETGYNYEKGEYKHDFDNSVIGLTLKVATFKIVAPTWSVDFLGSLALDFAASAVDSKKFNEKTLEENVQAYSMDNTIKGKHNVKITVADYQFGFGFGTGKALGAYNAETGKKPVVGQNNWDDHFNFGLTAVTPDYNFNGVTAKFGAGYEVDNQSWALAASAKAGYEADKWSVSGAYDVLKIGDEDLIANDFALAFSFAPVSVDVYFANEGSEADDKYYDYFENKDKHFDVLPSNYLSAKVVVDVAKVAENVPVTVTLTGLNLVNKEKQDLSVAAETTVVPNFKFGVYFNDWFDYGSRSAGHQKLGATVEFTGVEKLTLNGEVAYRFNREDTGFKTLFINAGAEYAHDLFTASATVAMEKDYEQDAKFGAVVGAKSTTLVAGAEISAKARFNLKNLSKLDTTATNDLTFACKVSF